MKTLQITANVLIFLATASITLAQAGEKASTSVEEKVATCQKSTGANGHMPWGATDQDLASYQGNNLCTYNDGRPIGANCRKTLKKLYEVGKDINTMVKEGCEKYIPLFENPEMMECYKNHNHNCNAASSKALSELNSTINVFKAKLAKFTSLMNEQQKYVVQSSEKVVDVLDENEKYRNSSQYNMPSPGAQKMGVSTISESDALNNQQDAAYARSLWMELQNKFKDSEKNYTDVTDANYQQKLAPITESFKKVGALKSKVLREQLHGFLKAEELKLATHLYDNQLDGLENNSNKFIAFNNGAEDGLTSLPSNAAAAAASSPTAYSPSSGLPSVTGNSSSKPSSLSASPLSMEKTAAADSGENWKPTASTPGTGHGTQIASTEGENPDSNEISATSASRSPGSLRDSLRDKIAAEAKAKAAANAGEDPEASEAGAVNKPGADGSVAEGTRGDRRVGTTDTEALASDGALSSFSGSLSRDGAISLSGPGGDDAVKELIGEFRTTLREQAAPLAAGVAAMDSESLFERVKEFHIRCLKRGCVAGAGKAGNL